jgi:hypothetical protein
MATLLPVAAIIIPGINERNGREAISAIFGDTVCGARRSGFTTCLHACFERNNFVNIFA